MKEEIDFKKVFINFKKISTKNNFYTLVSETFYETIYISIIN